MMEGLIAELERFSFSLPIMEELSDFLQDGGSLSGQTIGWHCHLTSITAATASVIVGAGARLIMSECNPATTSREAVAYMQELGCEVFLGADSCRKVLDRKPRIISDTGLALTQAYLADHTAGENYVFAASEITTSGISRLRELKAIPLPVLNINDGQIKSFVENFHGVGDGLCDALFRLTGRMWSGRKAAVFGYGRVGAGVAAYLKRAGADVSIVEPDPVRRLIAHYDGYALTTVPRALNESQLVVTATGKASVLGGDNWAQTADNLIIVNVGHWAHEIDVPSLRQAAMKTREIASHLEEFTLAANKKIYLVAGGSPANVVLLSGSAEPTLIHLTTEVLCMNYLTEVEAKKTVLAPGEMNVPAEVERQASLLALRALGLAE